MKTIRTISVWAAFVWLWRNDPEAKWFWLKAYLLGFDLRLDMFINLKQFGETLRDYR